MSPIDAIDVVAAFPRTSSAMSDLPEAAEQTSLFYVPDPLYEPSVVTPTFPTVVTPTSSSWNLQSDCGKRYEKFF